MPASRHGTKFPTATRCTPGSFSIRRIASSKKAIDFGPKASIGSGTSIASTWRMS